MSRPCTHTWEIKDFNLESSTGSSLRSVVFWNDQNYKWELELYPKGDNQYNRDYLSVFLNLVSSPKPSNISAKAKVAIFDAYGHESLNREHAKYYSVNDPIKRFGFPKFINGKTLIEEGHLHKGTLKLFCKVSYRTSETLNDMSVCRPKNDLSNMLMDTAFSDIKFQVGKETFPAHKVILASKSPTFHQALRLNKSGTIVITNATPHIFKEMLRFMYTGTVKQLHAYAKDLIVAAEYYKVYDLSELCVNYLVGALTVDNAIEMVQFAKKCECTILENKVLKFINTKFVKETPKYLVDQLTNVLKNSKVH